MKKTELLDKVDLWIKEVHCSDTPAAMGVVFALLSCNEHIHEFAVMDDHTMGVRPVIVMSNGALGCLRDRGVSV